MIEFNAETIALIDEFLKKGVSKLRVAEKKKKERKKASKSREQSRQGSKASRGGAGDSSQVRATGDNADKAIYDNLKQQVAEKKTTKQALRGAQSHPRSMSMSSEKSGGGEASDGQIDAGCIAETFKITKPMPIFDLLGDDPDQQAIIVRKLIARSAVLKKAEVQNYEAKLDGFVQKKKQVSTQWKLARMRSSIQFTPLG